MPTAFQTAFQGNMLKRHLEEQLGHSGALREAAERTPIPIRSGETFIYSSAGRIVPVVQPVNVSGYTVGSDLSGTRPGVGSANNAYTVEQFGVSIADRDYGVDINVIQDEETLASFYAQNWVNLEDQADNSLDQIATAQTATAYESGVTWITAAVGSAASTNVVHVDNTIGFDTAYSTVTIGGNVFAYGQPTALGTLTQNAICYPASGAASFPVVVTVVAVDGTNTSTMVSSGMINGTSGNLTLTYSGSSAFAIGDVLVANDSPVQIRPGGARSRFQLQQNSTAALQLLINARAQLKRNGVPPFADGSYLCVMDPTFQAQIFTDPQFQIASQGAVDSAIFKNAKVNKLVGLTWKETTNTPVYNFTNSAGQGLVAHRAYVIGRGAIQECTFEGMAEAYKRMANSALSHVEIVKDYALITRPGIDSKGQIWTQTWTWIGGYTARTDVTINKTIFPTATPARYKRVVAVEVADFT
jgi:hypothetical protein